MAVLGVALAPLVACASSGENEPTLATRAPEITDVGNITPFAARAFRGAATHTVTLPSGESIVVGFFTGTTDFGLGERSAVGGGDIFLVKLDADGNPVWHETFGTEQEDEPAGMVVEDDGSIAVLGSHDQLPLRDWSSGPRSTFLLRFDPRGHLLDQRSLPEVTPYAFDRLGDRYVASTAAPLSVGSFATAGDAPRDAGLSGDHGIVRAVTTRGDRLVAIGAYAGTMRAGGTTLPIGAGTAFIVSLSQSGVEWTRAWRHASLTAARLVADGTLLVGGACDANCAVPPSDGEDAPGPFVAALDANGRVLWSRRFVGRFGDSPANAGGTVTSLALAPNGVVHAVGTFSSRMDLGDRSVDPYGGASIFHVAISSGGATLWGGRYAATAAVAAPIATVDAHGHVFVTGSAAGSFDLHVAHRAATTDAGWFFARVTD